MHYAGKPFFSDIQDLPGTPNGTKERVHVKRIQVPSAPFEQSDDWEIQFDVHPQDEETPELRKNAPFPAHIAPSSRRPDGLMWSDKLKTVMWIELTSPWEENMTKWYFEKHSKYNRLMKACEDGGWKVIPLCVEVGARGFIHSKWSHMRKAIGLSTAVNRKLKYDVGKIASRCSYFLYLNRRLNDWNTSKLIYAQVDSMGRTVSSKTEEDVGALPHRANSNV
jgi:hypothetical protein